jgi:hypothetical protein
MKPILRALSVVALFAGGAAFAQSSLFLPNNSAGSPLDTPPVLVQPPAEPRTADTPKRTETEVTAQQQREPAERDPAPREGVRGGPDGREDEAETK